MCQSGVHVKLCVAETLGSMFVQLLNGDATPILPSHLTDSVALLAIKTVDAPVKEVIERICPD